MGRDWRGAAARLRCPRAARLAPADGAPEAGALGGARLVLGPAGSALRHRAGAVRLEDLVFGRDPRLGGAALLELCVGLRRRHALLSRGDLEFELGQLNPASLLLLLERGEPLAEVEPCAAGERNETKGKRRAEP